MGKNIAIIGAGISGITLAERFAAKNNKVTLIEQRNHIGGNCYDLKNQHGILIHQYGPHIFHSDFKDVWQYLSRFTQWINYKHKVLGFIDGKFASIPFNLNSLHIFFPKNKARELEQKLIKTVGLGNKVAILEFMKSKDQDLKFLANFVYQKVFLEYTMKQWDLKPKQIDPSVTGRVPIVVSKVDGYFQDKYQAMPKIGYTKMFQKMLSSNNIKIDLNRNYLKTKNKVKADILIYTGAIDQFFNFQYGKLDYRHLNIKFRTFNKPSYQPAATVNYPALKYPFTRITEFKKLTRQRHKMTTIGKEFSGTSGFMAWPVNNDRNKKILVHYKKEVNKLKRKNVYFVGRLAEFKYYDMDDAVKNCLDFFKKIKK